MSFANFAAGVAGGYMQGKIAKKRDKRSERMDDIADTVYEGSYRFDQ
jgi:hypothetical protein